MTEGLHDFVTPLFEITYMSDPPPFSLKGSLERIRGWNVYRLPPLWNHGSEKRYKCTHRLPLNQRMPYELSNVTGDPIAGMYVDIQLVLRYQLNPYRPPHLPPPLGFEDCIYRNQRPRLREVFMELVPLRPGVDANDALSLGAAHGACGVQLYTEATGVFEEFPRNEENGLALIYSTVPWAREELQTTFDAGAEAPSLIVDDVFISWATLGLLSLNELSDAGALHTEEDQWAGLFDCYLTA
ncbi:hypothetical protein BCY84_09057 [Trypanosoma cruzi cruzi]|uniref:Uncharacterized protein n=1 Tax=Trypanosoma cruzi TaxID=5693 RepID=A0A2V2VZY6_TRYCR|nr:hypothetical protein BCY84_09057 [Trypanosoma cruzi cruzi]PWV01407.1 hypothetical protein C4B63_4g447 [Trypanosoma cruzi]